MSRSQVAMLSVYGEAGAREFRRLADRLGPISAGGLAPRVRLAGPVRQYIAALPDDESEVSRLRNAVGRLRPQVIFDIAEVNVATFGRERPGRSSTVATTAPTPPPLPKLWVREILAGQE
jgi:hypothetical protein